MAIHEDAPLSRAGGREEGFDEEISDEELTALALAEEPDRPLGPDAIAISLADPDAVSNLLPAWYMPATGAVRLSGWRSRVVLMVVLALLVIDALGLCATYGQVVLA